MDVSIAIIVVLGYFLLLITVSFLVGRSNENDTFFIGERKSPWYLVAFGMIGASLSGVTFISVPGWVEGSQFSYMQMVLGYFFGYLFIANVLMPIYYKLQLTSIYGYLERRFGIVTYKTGAGFFLLSRSIGAAFRLYLVAMVLDIAIFSNFNIPFWTTVLVTILLIWLYTFRSGIKTIVWTDTLQTASMLIAVVVSIFFICGEFGWSFNQMVSEVKNSEYSKVFFGKGSGELHFVKRFLSGVFIAIVMTGLDQDMMQKNLSCRNLGEAKKNMLVFSVVLILINLVFLVLGALLYIFAISKGLDYKGDKLYPNIALFHLNTVTAITFLIGIIAAAYSSADSALTSLTTSFCIDFLNFEKKVNQPQKSLKRIRYIVHISFSILLFVLVVLFKQINNDSMISDLFKAASYTYGPLLGLYFFGLFTKIKIRDKWSIVVCLISPIAAFFIKKYNDGIGFELLLINGAMTFMGLLLISDSRNTSQKT